MKVPCLLAISLLFHLAPSLRANSILDFPVASPSIAPANAPTPGNFQFGQPFTTGAAAFLSTFEFYSPADALPPSTVQILTADEASLFSPSAPDTSTLESLISGANSLPLNPNCQYIVTADSSLSTTAEVNATTSSFSTTSNAFIAVGSYMTPTPSVDAHDATNATNDITFSVATATPASAPLSPVVPLSLFSGLGLFALLAAWNIRRRKRLAALTRPPVGPQPW